MSIHEPIPQDKQRPYSIDLSLELEHQLDNESFPPSPAHTKSRPQSMDQHVLASIVRQLRATVEEVTKEREELREQLTKSEIDKTVAEDSLLHFSTRCARLEEELGEAKIKMKDDEDSIHMLRTKVEESRRGLMRLQTENRRTNHASHMSVDTSRTGLTVFPAQSSNKRSSFISLTSGSRTNGHKRISSVSDSSFLLPSLALSDHNSVSPSLNAQTDCSSDQSSPTNSCPPVNSGRISSIFGRTSSPELFDLPSKDPHVEEIGALRQEMKAMKADLEDTRHRLAEANEAREASEACANALRDFIASTQPSASESGPVRLPPMPTMTTGEEADTQKPASGWGAFRMWKMESAVKVNRSEAASSVSTRSLWKVDTAVKTPNSPGGTFSSAVSTRATPIAAPFTTKIGGFFASRGSISSVSSSDRPAPQSFPRQPSYVDSDTSSTQESVVEPISPASEVPEAPVIVCDSTSSSTHLNLLERVKIKILDEPVAVAENIATS